VTLSLSKAVHLYGLRCHDFLAIIDGAEMTTQTDIRAPSFAQLDRYCERVAVAVGRLSVRIFGEETSAGERVHRLRRYRPNMIRSLFPSALQHLAVPNVRLRAARRWLVFYRLEPSSR
jgi:presqualene diphosphate synthase